MDEDIILLQPEDSALIVELFGELFGSFLPFPPEAVEYFNSSFSEDNLLKLCERSGSLVAGIKREGELAAFLLSTAPEGGVTTIVWLVVSPKWQKMGLGEKLFKAACEYYRTRGVHKLKLTAPTLKAVEFYKRIGMTQEGFHPSHWWRMDFWSLGLSLN